MSNSWSRATRREGRRATRFADLTSRRRATQVDAAHDAVGPDTIAKFLFTSGSTGIPKCVINTQRMWCANQVMIRQALAYFADEPPVIVDWAPWHHTAGGNHDVGLVLYNGGTFYIDEGKPLPGAIEETVRNLREVAPTWYFTVPKGYEALLPYLRGDAELRRNFFSRLKLFWFAGAGIAQHVFDEIQELAVETCGERILFLTGFGSTETAPFALARTWHAENAANMGLPAPAWSSSWCPTRASWKRACAGPTSRRAIGASRNSPRRPSTRKASTGSATPSNSPTRTTSRQGLLFDGRIAEDFKLSTGTWVSVGPLRAGFIDRFAPYCARRGAGRAGPRRYRRAGVSRSRRLPQAGARSAADAPADDRAARCARARAVSPSGSKRWRAASTGSSNRVARALLLDGAALARQRRDDRQGLDQPARGADAPRRAGRRALRRPRRRRACCSIEE